MGNKVEYLNKNYSTTKLCYKLLDDKYLNENGKIKEEYKFKLNFPEFGIVDSKIPAKEGEKFDTFLFLPEGEDRKGEGGLRTRGYFKFSYEKVGSEWYVVSSNSEKIKKIGLPTTNYPLQTTHYPLITIITVVYNGEKYLEETIQSVINQTYPNVEYIIIDGGSTDGTLDIIKKYEERIDYWVSEKDCCMYEAINKGLLLSKGDIIASLNSDDMYYDIGVVDDIVNYFKIFTNIDGIYGKVVKLYKDSQKVKPTFQVNFEILLSSMHSTFMPQPTLFLRKNIYKKYNFDLSYKYASDYDFNLKIIKLFNIKFFNKKITLFRQHDESITNSGKLENDRKKILINHGLYKINIIKRLYYYYKYWIKYKILDLFND